MRGNEPASLKGYPMNPIEQFEKAIGLKGAIAVIEVNGAWMGADTKSRSLLRKCGLDPAGRFLSYDLLLHHVSDRGYCLETDAQ